ncbi:hypothetical protein HZS92_04602 [Xanthomonas citri pv. citri]|uniref:Secreted protein n=2 Tax=Xanthomonas citri pv. citri TaxID=611301 RepID=A0AAI7ZJB4_XANAC|nr:hypothetical protein XAC4338 [Xanthomonas citri pv. citri str. 306]QYF37874.1 hypothetical protein HZS91_04663 [Xanthomonas citri pv. citri]QYF42441.1 hypothetical protein HZS92_04602 [Xanthomonas citri pv. citri]QYF47280.1 hypothetical protein HZS93_04663 [Xanthomonas citri]
MRARCRSCWWKRRPCSMRAIRNVHRFLAVSQWLGLFVSAADLSDAACADFQGRGDAILSYADLTGAPFYRTAQSAFDRNRLMVGIGAALPTEQGLSTRLEYRGITDGDSSNDQTWMINLEKKY